MIASFVAVFVGILLWTFLEYVLHRWLGHDRRTMPNFFSKEHTRHHSEGGYFAPAWKKSLAAIAVLAVVGPLAVVVAGPAIGVPFSVAFVAMYLAYEAMHWAAHVYAGLGRYGRWMRRHHFHHHFSNPKSNHGVTSPLWDIVFGTLEEPDRIRVPEKLQMRWLCDPSTGDVREAYRGSYELIRRPASAT